jgi:hypothetical protein
LISALIALQAAAAEGGGSSGGGGGGPAAENRLSTCSARRMFAPTRRVPDHRRGVAAASAPWIGLEELLAYRLDRGTSIGTLTEEASHGRVGAPELLALLRYWAQSLPSSAKLLSAANPNRALWFRCECLRIAELPSVGDAELEPLRRAMLPAHRATLTRLLAYLATLDLGSGGGPRAMPRTELAMFLAADWFGLPLSSAAGLAPPPPGALASGTAWARRFAAEGTFVLHLLRAAAYHHNASAEPHATTAPLLAPLTPRPMAPEASVLIGSQAPPPPSPQAAPTAPAQAACSPPPEAAAVIHLIITPCSIRSLYLH